MENRKVKVRIAPSPTGDPHVGTAYIGLFNYAYAKHNGGEFILRIEDTDRTRFSADSEQQIFDAMKWLGLYYDEGPDVGGDFGPYRQSERMGMYKKYADMLVDNGGAYCCFCTQERLTSLRERQVAMNQAPGYDGHCRKLTKQEVEQKKANNEPYIIRLKMPYDGQTIVKDMLRGDIVFENSKIDDQVLLKSDGFPTYHLANIVDDHLMGITDVIRAEEWIASTPKHVQLYKAFGWEEPKWYHMPLLRNADKTKISKRKNPVSLNYYRQEGYLKEAMLNFLALMGWSMPEDKEIFTLDEMINNFTFDRISLGGPVFDLVKLGWVNNHHMRLKDIKELTELALPYFEEKYDISNVSMEDLQFIVEVLREGAHTLKELASLADIYFNDKFVLQQVTEEMNKKERKSVTRLLEAVESEKGKEAINLFKQKIEKEEENISCERAKQILQEVQDELNEGPAVALMPLRAVLTGKARGADLYTVIKIIGKTRILNRISQF